MKETGFSISAKGTVFKELFKDVSCQLLRLLIDPAEVGEVIREKIVLEAPDARILLNDWVQSLVNLAKNQNIIFSQVRFLDFRADAGGAVQLKAEVIGELVDPVRHTFRNNLAVFRVTHVQITQEPDQITAQISF